MHIALLSDTFSGLRAAELVALITVPLPKQLSVWRANQESYESQATLTLIPENGNMTVSGERIPRFGVKEVDTVMLSMSGNLIVQR